MRNPRAVNAIIFGIFFLAFAPFLGGLVWGIFIVRDAISQTGNSFGMAHLNLIYVTIISAYKHVFFPTMFAGLVGGWWRSSYKKLLPCIAFGVFAAIVISVYKYFEYVVFETPFMQATNFQYLKIILSAYALPAFIISVLIAYFARSRA